MDKKGRRPQYSQEFRHEAVNLADRIGIAKAANDLGVSSGAIRNWAKKLKGDGVGGATSGGKAPSYSEIEKENRRLQKEIGYLKEINQVLKKSTAIFSTDLMGSKK